MASPEHPALHATPGGPAGTDPFLPLHPPALVGRDRELSATLQVLPVRPGSAQRPRISTMVA